MAVGSTDCSVQLVDLSPTPALPDRSDTPPADTVSRYVPGAPVSAARPSMRKVLPDTGTIVTPASSGTSLPSRLSARSWKSSPAASTASSKVKATLSTGVVRNAVRRPSTEATPGAVVSTKTSTKLSSARLPAASATRTRTLWAPAPPSLKLLVKCDPPAPSVTVA